MTVDLHMAVPTPTVDPAPDPAAPTSGRSLAERMLDIKRIYHEPDIERFPRAQQVLARYPEAERIEVPSQSFAREKGVSEELDSFFP